MPASWASSSSSPAADTSRAMSPGCGSVRARATRSRRCSFQPPTEASGTDHAAVEVEPAGAAGRRAARRSASRDPQQVADHQPRHRPGEMGDQVHAPVAVGLRSSTSSWSSTIGLHPREPRGQAARGELRGEQPSQLRVVRRIAEPETAGIELPSEAGPADDVAEVVAERAGVGEHGAHLVVPGDHPAAHARGSRTRRTGGPSSSAGAGSSPSRCSAARTSGEQGVEQPGSGGPQPGRDARQHRTTRENPEHPRTHDGPGTKPWARSDGWLGDLMFAPGK